MSNFTEWFNEKRNERLLQQYQKVKEEPGNDFRRRTSEIKDYMKRYGGKAGLDEYTMANYQDQQSLLEAKQSTHWSGTAAGVGMMSSAAFSRHIGQVAAEEAKDKGTGNLQAYGVNSGTSHTIKQARAVAEGQGRKALAKDFFGHINPLGASGKESILNSMGIFTADQKVNMGRTMTGRAMMGFSKLAVGHHVANTLVNSEDPLTDLASDVASGTGMMAGWRGGKAAANVLFGKAVGHTSRVLLGAAGGFLGGAIPMVAGEIAKTVTKQDSWLLKGAEKSYAQEQDVYDKSSRLSLTMRQAGLQKLSSSHLNGRGQLLGNEAAILRGASS